MNSVRIRVNPVKKEKERLRVAFIQGKVEKTVVIEETANFG